MVHRLGYLKRRHSSFKHTVGMYKHYKHCESGPIQTICAVLLVNKYLQYYSVLCVSLSIETEVE
jgi:hypothetical protein